MILILVVTVFAATNMIAQEGKHQQKSAEERTEKIIGKMKVDLMLSDDQAAKLKPVILKREQQRDAMRAKMEDDREHHKQMSRETDEELKKILSPEQMDKLKQQRKEMHDKRMERRTGMQNKED